MQKTLASTNAPLVGGLVFLHGVALVALPLQLLNSPGWAPAILLLVPLSVVHWGLIHEGIHKLLHDDAAINERQSRALGVLMGASFHVLRFGHLMHHKLNRDWHSERMHGTGLRDKAAYYCNLFFGLYLGEVVTSLMFTFLPRRAFMRIANATFLRDYPEVAVAGERFFFERAHARHVRQDMLATLALYGASAWLYGPYAGWLAAFIVGRAVVISFLDNIYHYETPSDNSRAGKELVLSPRWSKLLLHSNYHETHHLNPTVPWHALPATHRAQGRAFDGPWLAHAAMQLRPPAVA